MTWKDVFKMLVCCGALLFLVLGTIWAIEADMAIRELEREVGAIKATQRPLISIDGAKYLSVFAQDDNLLIKTGKEACRE